MSGLRRFAFHAMGTRIELIVEATADPGAEAAVRSLFEERDAALSRFRPDSELSRLNGAGGRPTRVGPLLAESVVSAIRAARITDGAFDPTLGVQMRAHGYDRPLPAVRARGAGPTATVAPGGGWRGIAVDVRAHLITLPAGVELDLGGIAKGAAADAALALLAERGVRAALVSAGGDVVAMGSPPERRGWTVAIATPRGPVPVTLERGAIATSGIGRRYWRAAGRARHHLLDPATGEPCREGVWSVSVAAASGEHAEVGATAAFVLGVGPGTHLLARHGLPGLFVGSGGASLPVGGWPAAASGPAAAERPAA